MSDKNKKTTDANALLRASANANDVPRGGKEPAPTGKRINVAVQEEHHKRLKLLATLKGQNLQEALDELLNKHLPPLPNVDL